MCHGERAIDNLQRIHVEHVAARFRAREAVVHEVQEGLAHLIGMRGLVGKVCLESVFECFRAAQRSHRARKRTHCGSRDRGYRISSAVGGCSRNHRRWPGGEPHGRRKDGPVLHWRVHEPRGPEHKGAHAQQAIEDIFGSTHEKPLCGTVARRRRAGYSVPGGTPRRDRMIPISEPQ